MIDTINAREAERQELAGYVAAFVAQNGPIETLPIIVGEDKKLPYRISCPESRKPAQRIVKQGPGKGSSARAMRAANIERVRPFLDSGLSLMEIGRRTGLTGPTVSSIFKELRG